MAQDAEEPREHSAKNQRWYDQDQTISQSVKLLETFPSEIQSIIADGIIRLADRECHASELMNDLRSMGPEKVLSIFKSKNKRRTYDNNQAVHRAMNYMYVLSEENRLLIAQEVIAIVNFIYEYLTACNSYQMPIETQQVSMLVEGYIETGPEETQRMLQEIQRRFIAALQLPQHERLVIDQKGMKIRDDRTPPS